MFNFIIKYPVFTLILIVAAICVLGWANNGGLEAFHNGLTDKVVEASGAESIADKIRNPYG